ncbi:MAG: pyridoxal-phosphate dependent enzyme [Bacilli bacterium]|nr:pyridoxal-phosphate dependent enzyme [Bacilli bacterium]
MKETLIQKINNNLYIKRDDLIPISFGGNKARKAINFFHEIDNGNYDCVVTYGSSSSNHCRIVSNMCASRNIKCYIISPKEASETTFNKKMMELFEATIIEVPVDSVHDTIENKLKELKKSGLKPYFIPGGGHGNLGTKAYIDCYDEIIEYEKTNNIRFDYIFFASGTGTTHAGLVCGQYLNHDYDKKIVGISIARKNPRGKSVVLESIYEYLNSLNIKYDKDKIEDLTIFDDSYTGDGYGKENEKIISVIKDSMIKYGIPLDSTYTGKAFYGMQEYLIKKNIKSKNILFIHTGGTPLFFNDLERM